MYCDPFLQAELPEFQPPLGLSFSWDPLGGLGSAVGSAIVLPSNSSLCPGLAESVTGGQRLGLSLALRVGPGLEQGGEGT